VKVNDLLLTKSAGKTYSDPEKQYYSEYFKLLAVILKDALKKKELQHDTVAVQNARNSAYLSGLKLGVDFRRLALTDNGFKKI
jgi:hypothetical protein